MESEDKDLSRWQWRLRPLMSWTLILLTAFFFTATLFQLVSLNQRIEQSPTINPAAVLKDVPCPDKLDELQCSTRQRLALAAAFEAHIIERRHHQASVTLMASIWSRYLGFITGMILALVGAAFILGQLRDTGTKLDGEVGGNKISFDSASPGLVMVALGVVLMISTIVTLHKVETGDSPLYFIGDTQAWGNDPKSTYGKNDPDLTAGQKK